MNKTEAKKEYIKSHPLGALTVKQLRVKAEEEGIFVYGDKAQILQCFDQSRHMTELFRVNSY